jgi:hypothetical protein
LLQLKTPEPLKPKLKAAPELPQSTPDVPRKTKLKTVPSEVLQLAQVSLKLKLKMAKLPYHSFPSQA